MNKIACQYALLRFRPFVETGEFANVGVVLLAPEARFFGFRISKKYSRLTQFFHGLDSAVYRNSHAFFKQELNRFEHEIRRQALDGRKRVVNVPVALNQFTELVRPREGLLYFDEPRLVLAEDPKAKLKALYEYYVEHNFVTREYQERLLEDSVRRLLMRAHVGAEFQRAKVGTDDFEVNFPFVRKQNYEPTQVIKPLFLARTDSTRVLTHGGLWVDKVRRLRKRHALPAQVLFPVSVPDPQTRAFAAYEEIRTDLQQEGVQVVAATDEARILEFAAPEERDHRHATKFGAGPKSLV